MGTYRTLVVKVERDYGSREGLMATFEGRELRIEEAKRLNDLQSFAQDLERARRFCDAYLLMSKDDKRGYPSGPPADALLIAVVVTYARMFTTGVRKSEMWEIAQNVYDAKQLERHQYLKDLRDKHIAHSVNDFEDSTTTVSVRLDGDAIEVMGIGSAGYHTYGIGPGVLQSVPEMLNALEAGLKKEIESESAKVLAIVKKMSPADLAKLELPLVGLRDLSKVGERRKQE